MQSDHSETNETARSQTIYRGREDAARLRTFLVVIRDSAKSGPFARMMAATALSGDMGALAAEDYWNKHAAR